MSAAATVGLGLWLLGLAVIAAILWTVFIWWPSFKRLTDHAEAARAFNRTRPLCLDCIEYGAPYDAPCEFCGRITPHRIRPVPHQHGAGNGEKHGG